MGVGTVTGPTGTTGTSTATGTAGVITNCVSGVNFRTGAGTSNTLLGTLPKGAPVMVLSSTTGSDGKTWYKVTYNNTTGYVSGQYVSVTGTVSSGSGTTSGTTSTTGTPGQRRELPFQRQLFFFQARHPAQGRYHFHPELHHGLRWGYLV